jgi:hypothetical protein
VDESTQNTVRAAEQAVSQLIHACRKNGPLYSRHPNVVAQNGPLYPQRRATSGQLHAPARHPALHSHAHPC